MNGMKGDSMKTIAKSKKTREYGLDTKMPKLPLDRIRDCRKDSSNIGPKTNAIIKGGASRPNFFKR